MLGHAPAPWTGHACDKPWIRLPCLCDSPGAARLARRTP